MSSGRLLHWGEASVTEVDPQSGAVHCSMCGWCEHNPIPEDESHCPCMDDGLCRCLCHVADEDLSGADLLERYSDD